MTHRGREVLVIGDATVSIRCEGCGTVHRAVVHGCEIDLDERPTPA